MLAVRLRRSRLRTSFEAAQVGLAVGTPPIIHVTDARVKTAVLMPCWAGRSSALRNAAAKPHEKSAHHAIQYPSSQRSVRMPSAVPSGSLKMLARRGPSSGERLCASRSDHGWAMACDEVFEQCVVDPAHTMEVMHTRAHAFVNTAHCRHYLEIQLRFGTTDASAAWCSNCQIQKKASKERRFAFRARGTKGAACGAVHT